MKSDLDISQEAPKKNITEIAAAMGIDGGHLSPYGKYKGKIDLKAMDGRRPDAKLILVTAINPTKAGEGKTTCTIGLADSLNRIGKKTAAALREPSLGPVFGLKGGAAGGGYAQVVPMEEINLHFTGDLHAITSANNLICACIDNHIHFGNALDIQEVTFRRCLDISDRMLRNVVTTFREESRKDSFNITVASEIMAILCLASGLEDLRRRIDRIIIGRNSKGADVTVSELGITGSVIALLKEAINPNLVQTLAHTPVFIHGGPFANMAHGCNSAVATKMAMCYNDYVVTEAGFGADLGAEKFVDIKCRTAGIAPSAIVVVASIRALKLHGGVPADKLSENSPEAVRKGFGNFSMHIRHMRENFGYPVAVCGALNRFPTDTGEELAAFEELCRKEAIDARLVTSFSDGASGAVELAKLVTEKIAAAPEVNSRDFCSYSLEDGVYANIAVICRKFYEVNKIEYSNEARAALDALAATPANNLPLCMAKTPYALNDGSEDPDLIHIREVIHAAGAGFIILKTGSIMTMPGLPEHPQAERIDVKDGRITGMS